jgi:hypothetical protein
METSSSPIKVTATLSSLAYRGYPLPVIGTLLAVLKIPSSQSPDFSKCAEVDLKMSMGSDFDISNIRSHLTNEAISFEESDEADLSRVAGQTHEERLQHARSKYNSRLEADISQVVTDLKSDWPEIKTFFTVNRRSLINVDSALEDDLLSLVNAWSLNHHFLKDMRRIPEICKAAHNSISSPPSLYNPTVSAGRKHPNFLHEESLDHLLSCRTPWTEQSNPFTPTLSLESSPQNVQPHESIIPHLNDLYDRLCTASKGPLESEYSRHLHKSINALSKEPLIGQVGFHSKEQLSTLENQQKSRLQSFTNGIIRQLQEGGLAERTIQAAGLWPRITTKALLRCLSLKERKVPSSPWTSVFRHLAELVVLTQQSRRLIQFSSSDKAAEYHAELVHSRQRLASHDMDWLLIEIDADISIRNEQVHVAEAMIYPDNKDNVVMQLNMGKGKSSVSDHRKPVSYRY